MTKYREIIRLTGLGFSQRNIMASCGVSQKTVVKVQKRARELNISWPLDESMTDTELQKLMFSKESKVSASKKMPDYAYIRKELLRNGVTKKLLWTEYIEAVSYTHLDVYKRQILDCALSYPITTPFSTVLLVMVIWFCPDAYPPINPDFKVCVPAFKVTLSILIGFLEL